MGMGGRLIWFITICFSKIHSSIKVLIELVLVLVRKKKEYFIDISFKKFLYLANDLFNITGSTNSKR
jgi:hypothetical protein